MKYLNKFLVLFLFAIGIFSCDKNENFEILPAQESLQIITPTNGSVIVLNDANLENNALFISWKSPNISDTFTIEVAKTGTDFASVTTLATTQDYNFSMTVDELNSFLLDVMEIDPEVATSLDIRVASSTEVSQTIAVIVTPYTVEYTEFYLVGSITNWTPAEALAMTNTGFNTFEITVDLPDGAEFKFLPTNAGWDGDFGKDPDNEGMLIQEGEVNLSGYTAGKYKIAIDLNTFTYTVDEVISPNNLYLVGSLTGWDPTTALPFKNTGENIYTIVVNLPSGAEFKFLPTNTGWDGDWGKDPNNEGSIIQDGEVNLGGYDAGKYLVTVDFNTLTYKLTAVNSLFVVGSINGWDNGAALTMGEASLGIFSIVLDLPDGAEFKFLPTLGSWDGDWGADANNAGRVIQDGEVNVSGYAAGKYVVSVNFNTLTFNVSPVTAIPSNLYLVGSFNGWNNDAASPAFTEIESGVFQITQALDADAEFKFVPVAGNWGNDWGESKVSSKVLEQGDEQNVKVTEAGTYVITVNFNKGTISYTK